MIRNTGPMTETMRSRTSTAARSRERGASARGVRDQPDGLNSGHAGLLVLIARSAARSRRAENLAFFVLDQDAARLRQEFSLGRCRERDEEIGVVLGALQERAARD